MQAQFSFRHMESSNALRSYAEERLGKISRYFSDPLKVHCTLSVEKISHTAQFDVTLRNGLQLHASESTENMYSSIDMALAKMERQVRRYKDRITSHKPHKGRAARVRQRVFSAESVVPPLPVEPEIKPSESVLAAREQVEKDVSAGPQVIREKEFKAERLEVQQAIMQMNLLHKSFLVFTNVSTGDINVVYQLDDGNYGLIETSGHVEGA
jgi:putative sigma-54 modulation protein